MPTYLTEFSRAPAADVIASFEVVASPDVAGDDGSFACDTSTCLLEHAAIGKATKATSTKNTIRSLFRLNGCCQKSEIELE